MYISIIHILSQEDKVPVFPAGLPDGGGVLRLPRGQPRRRQARARRVLRVGRRVHAEEQDEGTDSEYLEFYWARNSEAWFA